VHEHAKKFLCDFIQITRSGNQLKPHTEAPKNNKKGPKQEEERSNEWSNATEEANQKHKHTLRRQPAVCLQATWTWICSRDEFQIGLKFISSYSTFMLFPSSCNASPASAIPAKT
jgi:hypothetical protein